MALHCSPVGIRGVPLASQVRRGGAQAAHQATAGQFAVADTISKPSSTKSTTRSLACNSISTSGQVLRCAASAGISRSEAQGRRGVAIHWKWMEFHGLWKGKNDQMNSLPDDA